MATKAAVGVIPVLQIRQRAAAQLSQMAKIRQKLDQKYCENDKSYLCLAQSDEKDVNRKQCLFKILSKSISAMSMECKIGH